MKMLLGLVDQANRFVMDDGIGYPVFTTRKSQNALNRADLTRYIDQQIVIVFEEIDTAIYGATQVGVLHSIVNTTHL